MIPLRGLLALLGFFLFVGGLALIALPAALVGAGLCLMGGVLLETLTDRGGV